jgi:hypothetical protein
MIRSVKHFVLWLDAGLSKLWNEVLMRKEVFIHGDFTYWGFFKNNVHLFLVLGLFGALTGYLNIFIEREVPFNVYAGKLGINQTPISILQSAMSGRNPLSTPFPPADLIFGITCSLIMFILIATAILWAAVNYKEGDVHPSSEFSLIMRISFVTIFGSLMLVFISYLIRNYGLMIQALLEIFSAFAAIYVISFVLKRAKDPWPWLIAFIFLGAAVYAFHIYLPAVSIFSVAIGLMSLTLAVLMVPFLLIKKAVRHIKERHMG